MPFHGWNAKVRSLGDIAASQALSLRNLVSKIDLERKHGNLSSTSGLATLNFIKVVCHVSTGRLAPNLGLGGGCPGFKQIEAGLARASWRPRHFCA